MTTHACVIVGPGQVGAVHVPAKVPIGQRIELRYEADPLPKRGAVAAYYRGSRIGYLSAEGEPLGAFKPRFERRAKVVGQILDEHGCLAGLDVEILAGSHRDQEAAPGESRRGGTPSGRRRVWSLIAGAASICLAMGAGADRIAPGGRPDVVRVTSDESSPRVPVAHAVEPPRRPVAAVIQDGAIAADIAELRRRAERLSRTRLQMESERQRFLALEEISEDELLRQGYRMRSWSRQQRAMQATNEKAPESIKTKNIERISRAPAQTAAPRSGDEAIKMPRKANFSRYSVKNRALD